MELVAPTANITVAATAINLRLDPIFIV